MNSKAVRQYLERYAEPEARLLTDWPGDHHYKHVLIIPAYQESPLFLQELISATWFQQNVLVILVINQPDNITDPTPQQHLHHYGRQHSQKLWENAHLELLSPTPKFTEASGHILLVNRYDTPLPHKQGVGLARKTGADLALALIRQNIIHSEWITSSDADATLPDNYFSALNTLEQDTVGACYAFEHTGGPPAVNAATLIYERALKYYVAGLNYAGSPYAFFTIGSTLAFQAQAYAEVRGFPKKAAGEDFYLLNKLAKTGRISPINNATITLEARLSNRVPFGTGMSTAKIMQLTEAGLPFCYYHPQTFSALQQVLQHFEALWDQRENLTHWLNQLPESSAEVLLAQGLPAFIAKQNKQCRSKSHFTTQLHQWFDALKTLRFIHGIRDRGYPDLPIDDAINLASFPATQ